MKNYITVNNKDYYYKIDIEGAYMVSGQRRYGSVSIYYKEKGWFKRGKKVIVVKQYPLMSYDKMLRIYKEILPNKEATDEYVTKLIIEDHKIKLLKKMSNYKQI